MNAEEIRKISEDYDIGGHTLNHVNLTRISTKKARDEISKGKKILEEICNKEIVSFCYPWGNFSQKTIDIVNECGFKGARSTEIFSRKVADPFRMGTTVHAYNPCSKRAYPYFIHTQLKKKDFNFLYFILKKRLLNKSWDQIAIETLKFVLKNGGIWHLWGHSWEIEKYKDWERLELVFKKINATKGKYDARMLSNSDIFCALNHK